MLKWQFLNLELIVRSSRLIFLYSYCRYIANLDGQRLAPVKKVTLRLPNIIISLQLLLNDDIKFHSVGNQMQKSLSILVYSSQSHLCTTT